jgi:hypothetical protein
MLTPVPTEPLKPVYQQRDGSQHLIENMDAVDLMTALYDMLMRKAKHNHKLNKMLEVGETLSDVTKTIHKELATRDVLLQTHLDLQIAADLGRLSLKEDQESISLIKT